MANLTEILRAAQHKPAPPATLAELLAAVARATEIDVEEIAFGGHRRPINEARSSFALLAQRRLGATYPEIARACGDCEANYAWRWLKRGRAHAAESAFAARLARLEAELWPTSSDEARAA